ncbi:N6-adenosine-methyltransferase non-catalytic subunit MTB-like [Glycine soja]|uniref:Methyltransferase-like protein 1 isoform A n=1 Tax=Glycine soja TaxID=3848 RepID=A0A445F613_GLYSO|nr:N6-adenosine-methyltransferase non-catalytic subunit MTB-like [Glycine soja]XP_028221134.1 N6-adenosine-methyltransferase non-catalytic subunit MTB-like [Glycine soja]RZB44199.1 Methyltransferase-like protein 1 isoform A [Glycine soja]RZB44200.1 Methyltransferase-like protein 1 isoform B [Glycine soja]RZB44201.1 Methyltransferase-like protein 1 isoform C [Glycine soja]
MDSSDSGRGYSKRERDDEDWEFSDKRKDRSRKFGANGGDEGEGSDGSARRKRSSRTTTDGDDYDSRSKQVAKKRLEESTLEKLSSWYEDGELDDKAARKRGGDGEFHESVVCKEDGKGEGGGGGGGREKGGHEGKSSRRKWDEVDVGSVRKVQDEKVDLRSGKHDSSRDRERGGSARSEHGESKTSGGGDRVVKSTSKEDRRGDSERGKSKGKSDSGDVGREERVEKPRHHRAAAGYDVAETWDRSLNAEEDGHVRVRDKSTRESGNSNRSRTPEKSGKRHQDLENSEVDYERSSSFKRKEHEGDGYKDDRSKGKDDTWNDRRKDRESSKESWKRRQPSNTDKDSKNEESAFDDNRDWELPRHGYERMDNERPHGRFGGRKDVSRGEAVKTSTKFGISNDNYDVIEIQTKFYDYGKSESMSNHTKRTETHQQYIAKSGANDEEWAYHQDERGRKSDLSGSGTPGEDLKERYADDDYDFYGGRGRGQKGGVSARGTGGQSSSTGGSQPQYGNPESGSFNRAGAQGIKGNRVGRGGRIRPTGRDNQQVGIPLPMMGSPYGPLGMPPPGAMQPLSHGMSPAPGPPISPGVFMSPFTPGVWPGARGVDLNIIGVPPAVSPVPPGPRFNAANIGNPPNPVMYYNQSGPGRVMPPSICTPGFNPTGSIGRGAPPDKAPGGWAPPKSSGTLGKAPSRGEQNDYSQNFVDTGLRPQNFIRELELTNVVEDYPKLRELIQKKDEIVEKSASAPMYYKCDLKEFELSPEFFGTKFDVILVDPPWEEYVHRAPGVADHMEYWTFEEIMNLKIEAIADTPSFIFLWVGDGVGLEQGRQCLKKWGFRRCEDICWVKTNKSNATPGLRHDSHTLFQHSKEHCLMGIKGTVRRSTDGHIIHANIDTDVIIAEEPPYGSTQKPEDMYRIIEHFALGRRRLELFGEDHNIRAGWLTVGKELSSSNFNKEAYVKSFADKDGKVWQGGGGRNPPPEAPHLVVTTPDIEALRPKSPMKNQQQLQQQNSVSISLTSASASNRRPAGNSPQNTTALGVNQDASSSNPSTPAPWGSPLEGFKGREGSVLPSDDKVMDMYGFHGPASANYLDFESYRQMNLL